MNERLTGLRTRTRAGHFSQYRQPASPELIAECDREGLSWPMRMARLTRRMCEAEQVVVEPDERIVFTRTLPTVPAVYAAEDLAALTEGRTLHEGGIINNVCADWGMAIGEGLLGRRRVASETRARALAAGDAEAVEFIEAAIETIDAVLDLAARYAAEARRAWATRTWPRSSSTSRRSPPRTFHEALQSLRLLQAVVWLSRALSRGARPPRPVPVALSGGRPRGRAARRGRAPRSCWPSSSSRSTRTPTSTRASSRATTASR